MFISESEQKIVTVIKKCNLAVVGVERWVVAREGTSGIGASLEASHEAGLKGASAGANLETSLVASLEAGLKANLEVSASSKVEGGRGGKNRGPSKVAGGRGGSCRVSKDAMLVVVPGVGASLEASLEAGLKASHEVSHVSVSTT